jgi:prepilin signal peptidase PulO-like enzyme (type II secretory pathway)
MTPSLASDSWCASPAMLLVIVPAGYLAGRLLTRGVARLVEPTSGDRRLHRGIEIATMLAAVALWWWEVVAQGQLPAGGPAAPATGLCLRWAGHAILFLFLAAASWVDLKHRVIPDAITVPGVLAGLGWNTLFPGTLLPIASFVERSFATPAVEADVLGFGGGLAASQIPGGSHAAGLVTALVGLAVSAGLIWATRAGASWALGREAMGFGDVTLMAMAGAWLGWQACLLACGLAVFIGLVHGLGQLIRHAESELPFGPSLCLGLVTVVVAWRPLWELAGPPLEQPLDIAALATLVIGMTALTLWAWSRLRPR